MLSSVVARDVMPTAGDTATGVRRYGFGVLVVGGGYAATLTVADAAAAVFITGSGATATIERIPVRIVTGLLLGATLGPLASRMRGSRRRHRLTPGVPDYLPVINCLNSIRIAAVNEPCFPLPQPVITPPIDRNQS